MVIGNKKFYNKQFLRSSRRLLDKCDSVSVEHSGWYKCKRNPTNLQHEHDK